MAMTARLASKRGLLLLKVHDGFGQVRILKFRDLCLAVGHESLESRLRVFEVREASVEDDLL